jgi:hypothetical protein
VYVVEFQGGLAHHDATTLVADATSLVNTTQLGGNLNVTVASDGANTSADDLRKDVQLAIDTALVGGGFTIGFDNVSTVSNLSTGAIANGANATAAHAFFSGTSGVPAWDVPFTVTIPITGPVPTATGHGTLTRGSVISLGLVAALQRAITAAIRDANVTGLTVTVSLFGGDVRIASSGGQITVDFTSPLQASAGGGRVSITTSGRSTRPPRTRQPITPSVDMQPRVDISLDYADPSFQGLGLTSTPTRFDYSSGTKNEIAFTLFVNGTPVSVDLTSTTYTDIAGLVTQLSGALSSALTGAGFAGTAVKVCRVNLDPNASPSDHCAGTGSRIVLEST